MIYRMIVLTALACASLGCASTQNLLYPVAPAFDLTTLGGEPIDVVEYTGKVVFVEFWASWCGPCHRAFPHIQEAYDQYEDHPDVAFLLINTSWNDTPEQAALYLSLKQYTFPTAWDEGGRLAKAFGVKSIPTTFVIDRDGRIRYKKVGFNPAFGNAKTYSKHIDKQLQRPREAEVAQAQ